jgi:hypothetical protein
MKRMVLFLVLGLSALYSAVSVQSAEWGASVILGAGSWSGAWASAQRDFADDFGQSAKLSLFPAGSVLIDATFAPKPPFRFSLSIGAGTWGGRYVSSGGSAADRTGSIAAVGVELAPAVGVRFALGDSEIGASVRAGVGLLASPVYAIDAWSQASSVIEYEVKAMDRSYVFSGATLSYGIPLSAVTLSLLLSADVGLATFDSVAGGDPILLGRAGVGLRVSRDNGKTRYGR